MGVNLRVQYSTITHFFQDISTLAFSKGDLSIVNDTIT